MLPALILLTTLLPTTATTNAIQLDATGNIYLAGTTTNHAFIAKLSPDASKLLYLTPLAGSSNDAATALAVAPDGTAYVTGTTNSPDFPVTPGALQTTYTSGGVTQGFLAKINPAGVIIYATYIIGTSSTQTTGIAVDGTAQVYLTGLGGPGYSQTSGQPAQGFVLKLDRTLSTILLNIYGYGGDLIQLDSQANIYLAGSELPNITSTPATLGPVFTLPPFPTTAYQPTHAARFCLTLGSGPSPGGSYPCRYQYVAKLNPAGTLLWGTYVSGTYGAIARGMAVDTAGNVIVAGTTNSDDYPVTPGAFQTAYTAAVPPFPVQPGSTYLDPPPATGYVTKINATGTALLWSTYFGGSSTDRIHGIALAPNGDILLSGRAASADLPALSGTPEACRPSLNQQLAFVAHLNPDGATAGPTQVITGAPDCLYFGCPISSDYTNYLAAWPLALRPDGTALVAGTNGTVAALDPSPNTRLACVADPADNAQLRTVAPGQLLSLFGNDLAPAPSTTLAVSFNGVPAPILYSSAQQINVQVPYEIAGQSTVQLKVVNQQVPLPLSETRTLEVVDRQPVIFLSPAAFDSPFPGYAVCGSTVAIGEPAVALNADGTLNGCTNPAIPGTTVTVILNGLGAATPALATGAIAAAPSVPVIPAVDVLDSNLAPVTAATQTLPGAISGVFQVQFQLPPRTGPQAMTPMVLGKNLRERLILIWTR